MESHKPAVKDYYAVLDVSPDASASDIKKSYRSLVQRYHPDRVQSPEDAESSYQRMVDINEAFAVLSDSKRRADHDRKLAAEKNPPKMPQLPLDWEIPVTTTTYHGVPKNPAVDQTVAEDFLHMLKTKVGQQGAPAKLREEKEKSWLWSFLGKTWGGNYWVSLRVCPLLTPSAAQKILAQLQALIGRHRSSWKSSSFVFVLAFQSISDGESVLKLCRSYCNRQENSGQRNLVNIVVLDLKHRRSVLCGKRTRDPKLVPILGALAAG